jgi:hypothetical protein
MNNEGDWKSVKLKFESKKDNSSQDVFRSNAGVMSSLASSGNAANNNNFDEVGRWELEESEIDLTNARQIGKGAFGTVYKGRLEEKKLL